MKNFKSKQIIMGAICLGMGINLLPNRIYGINEEVKKIEKEEDKISMIINANKEFNTPPTISQVTIKMLESNNKVSELSEVNPPKERDMLKVVYEYQDIENDQEGKTMYQWYISDSKGGNYNPLLGIRTATIILLEEYEGKYLRCEVTPYDVNGNAGETVMSSETSIGVKGVENNPNTDWFNQVGYGISHHFISNHIELYAQPGSEWNLEEESWAELLRKFNVEEYAKQVKETGAGYVLLTLGQNSGYYCAPSETYDSYLREAGFLGEHEPNPKTPDFDFIEKFSDELAKYDIKLLLYFPATPPFSAHYEYTDLQKNKGDHRISTDVFDYTKGYDATPSEKARGMVQEMVKEWSIRYGDKVAGWFFDAVYRGPMGDSFKNMNNKNNISDLANAAKAGNPKAILSFNSAKQVTLQNTVYDDFTPGEDADLLELPTQMRWAEGSDDVQTYIFTVLGSIRDIFGGWGNPGVSKDTSYLLNHVTEIINREGVVCLDTYINRYGKIDPQQFEQLKQLSEVVKADKMLPRHNNSDKRYITYYAANGEVDRDEEWQYLLNTNKNNYYADIHMTTEQNASCEIKVTGVQGVGIIAQQGPESGLVDIYINDQLEQTVNLLSEKIEYGKEIFVQYDFVPEEEYRMKIINKEGKKLAIDGFNTYRDANIERIEFEKTSLEMGEIGSRKLNKVSVISSDENEAFNTLRIKSSDPEIVEVKYDKKGGVDFIAKKKGVTNIRVESAFDSNVYTECEVTVKDLVPIKLIDDTENSNEIQYSSKGQWYHGVEREADADGYYEHNRNVHATKVKGEYVEFAFEGTGIDIISASNIDQGEVNIYIDGELQETVDLSVPRGEHKRAHNITIFNKYDLTKGQHTVRIENNSDAWMIVDLFKIYDEDGVEKEVEIKLCTKEEVESNEQFDVSIALQSNEESVYALDSIIQYDTNKFTYNGVQTVVPTIGIDTIMEEGKVRLLMAIPNGIMEEQTLMRVSFTAKELQEPEVSVISLVENKVGRVKEGTSKLIHVPNLEQRIRVKEVGGGYEPGDVNEDKLVNVGDLALVAYYYQAKYGDDNWNIARKSDMNKDGIIDIEDLTMVSNEILNK